MRAISRPLAALGLSLALGAASLPAPAAAEWNQGATRGGPQLDGAATATIAALIALGVIGAIIDDDDDDDRDDRYRDDRRERVEVYRHGDDRWRDEGWRGERSRVLSAECVRHVRGGQRVLSGDCLADRGFHGRLPEGCRSDLYERGRYAAVYDMRCLRGSGYFVR